MYHLIVSHLINNPDQISLGWLQDSPQFPLEVPVPPFLLPRVLGQVNFLCQLKKRCVWGVGWWGVTKNIGESRESLQMTPENSGLLEEFSLRKESRRD